MSCDTAAQLPMTNTFRLLQSFETNLCALEHYIMLALSDTRGRETRA